LPHNIVSSVDRDLCP